MPPVSRAKVETILDHSAAMQRDGLILANAFHNGHWKYF